MPTPPFKQKRREGDYFRLVSGIIAEVEIVMPFWPTVTGVKLSGDSHHLNVYLVFAKDTSGGLDALNRAKGFVRSALASQISQRHVPEIHFIIDESQEQGARIDNIIEELHHDKK